MRLSFDSIEEVKEFVTNLKGKRNAKGEADDAPPNPPGAAPAPMQPPLSAAFAPPAPAAASAMVFPAAGAQDPQVGALVKRIVDRIEGPVVAAQPAATVLAWFQSQFVTAGHPEAATATMDQIKHVFLPKAATPLLDNLAKVIGA